MYMYVRSTCTLCLCCDVCNDIYLLSVQMCSIPVPLYISEWILIMCLCVLQHMLCAVDHVCVPGLMCRSQCNYMWDTCTLYVQSYKNGIPPVNNVTSYWALPILFSIDSITTIQGMVWLSVGVIPPTHVYIISYFLVNPTCIDNVYTCVYIIYSLCIYMYIHTYVHVHLLYNYTKYATRTCTICNIFTCTYTYT